MNILSSLLLVLLAAGCAHPENASQSSASSFRSIASSDLDPTIKDLCSKKIALLGESSHGDGRTLEFKVALVRRLINECHYDSFFIESGIYDFLNIERKLRSNENVTEQMVFSAIGGIWANEEIKPLASFLVEKAKSGALLLGGIDDQVGAGTYAQHEMSSELMEYLRDERKAQCTLEIQKYMLWQYNDKDPYSRERNTAILGCLDSVKSALANKKEKDHLQHDFHIQMVENLIRFFKRESTQFDSHPIDVVQFFNSRDSSMYLNFQWLTKRWPRRKKMIVWGHDFHMAKDLADIQGTEKGRVSFGSYIHKSFSGRAFALGFSAYSGSHSLTPGHVEQLSVAPDASLEGRAFLDSNDDFHYFGIDELNKFGAIEARPLNQVFMTAKWGQMLDGFMIFRREYPPKFFSNR